MKVLYASLIGFALDLLLGDPDWMPHPVVYMGKAITALEKFLRNIFPKTQAGKRHAGACMAVFLPVSTFVLSAGILLLCRWIHPLLCFAGEVIWSWQVLALRDLKTESMRVYDCLCFGTLQDARAAVSRIVGRDTQALSEQGVTKAAVETVAENFSDGVMAPLFWLMIGGAPLALTYKSINTMDSMVGYKNEKYLHFGCCAAKLDDAVNYIPSRLSALLLIASSALCGLSASNAFRIWRRDRRKHASPNSAQTESTVAGALQVQLAGPAYYFGQYYDKPVIGDDCRPIEPEDIRRANRLNYVAALLGLVLLSAVRAGMVYLWLR